MKLISMGSRRHGAVRKAVLFSAAVLICGLPARSQDRFPDGNGKPIVQRVCGLCHGINQAANRNMAREDWEWTVQRMLGYGAPIKPDEVPVLIDYLATNFAGPARPKGVVIPGPVQVNIKEWKIPTKGWRARDPLIVPAGFVYYLGQFNNKLGRFNPETEEFKEWILKTPKSGPHGEAADKDGNIWFTTNAANYLGKFDPKTEQITEYRMPDPAATGVHTPLFDKNGTLFFTLETGNMVGRMNPKTGAIDLKTVPTPKARPYGLVINSRGIPYFAEAGAGNLATFDPVTMEVKEFAMPDKVSGAGCEVPGCKNAGVRRIGITADDAIWYGDYNRGVIGRFDPKTGKFKEWPSPSGPLSAPYGMTAIGNIVWYNESGANPNTIVRFDSATEKFQSWALPSGGGAVRNMMPTPDGNLWIANSGADSIGRIEIKRSAN